MRKYQFTYVIFFFCILSFAWTDSSIKVHDVTGREIFLSNPAKRIISLVPVTTEILFAVGAGGAVVGITEYCNYPQETKEKETVGGFSGASISIEKIISLKPDLVFISGDMHSRIVSLLDQAGIVSFALEPKNMEDIFSSIKTIGLLTDCEDGASQVVLQMREKLARAKTISAGKERVTVFWEMWAQPFMTAGAQTFINEAISLAGGKNIFDDVQASWPEVNVEQIILRNPQWIISDDTYGMNQAVLLKRPGWSRIDAVRNNKIGTVNADIILRAGPRLADAILRMAELFHGDEIQR